MKRRSIEERKLGLLKETIRNLVPADLRDVAAAGGAGGDTCSAPTATACDCSGASYTDTNGTIYCTKTAR